MQCQDILDRLRALSDPEAVEGMARFGINPDQTLGVGLPAIRAMAKEIGKDHNLALELWTTGIREARLVAGLMAEPKLATGELLDKWVADFNSWDVCDGTCMNLFEKTEFAWDKAVEWSGKDEEFIKRAGFVMMARLAVSDKKAEDGQFEPFLPIIKRESWDERNYVKKAVNWALRQIGKRSHYLNRLAVETGEEIRELGTKSARWIAADALRELTDQKTLARIKR